MPRPVFAETVDRSAGAAAGARSSRGRTSSISISATSHFERTTSVEHLRLARDVGDGEILVDDALGRVDEDERHVGALGAPASARSSE